MGFKHIIFEDVTGLLYLPKLSILNLGNKLACFSFEKKNQVLYHLFTNSALGSLSSIY